MAGTNGSAAEDKSMGDVVNDLWLLCRDYAKQETVEPLKSLGKFMAWGVAGALALSLGVLFGAVSILRVLQTETGTTLTGSWNFVPYVVALLFTLVAALLAAMAIKRPFRAEEKA